MTVGFTCNQHNVHYLDVHFSVLSVYRTPKSDANSIEYRLNLFEKTESLPGTWIWKESKTKAVYTNWNLGEPSNKLATCGTIQVEKGWKWGDRLCSQTFAFICEKDI